MTGATPLTLFGPELGRVAISHPRVLVGMVVFLTDLVFNWRADHQLLNLPRAADGGYSIPRGSLYELISCPNYLGEIVQRAQLLRMDRSEPRAARALAPSLVPGAVLGPPTRSKSRDPRRAVSLYGAYLRHGT